MKKWYADKPELFITKLRNRPGPDIYDVSGECMVDFVGRFERINEDFETVRKRLGLKKSLPYLNHSQDKQTDAPVKKGYQSHFTPELEERIRQLYARDIELFGYKFSPVT